MGDAADVREARPGYGSKEERVPPGYKRTEVGVIPEGWEPSQIEDAAASTPNSIVGGPFGSDLVSSDYVSAGVPVIRGQNLSTSSVAGEFVFVSELKAKSPTANLARPGDLVFTQRGTLGQVSVVPDEPFGAYLVSQSQMKVSLERSRHDPVFVRQYFESLAGQKQIFNSAIQTGVPHTNLGILRSYRFPAPPLPEQRAIARALSDVDDLISAMDKLIEKKRAIKQATMQQLLTGRTRLPGFGGEWSSTVLGHLGEFSKGQGISRGDVVGEGVPCIRYGELYTHYRNWTIDTVSRTTHDAAQKSLPVRAGDLLFAASAETAEEIGACVAYLGNDVAYAGGDIVVLRPDQDDPCYLGYLLNHESITVQKARVAQGDAVVHISARNLSRIELRLPPLPEQRAIATVLSDMDAEIAALERRWEKTRLVKQGMMQELLTGRIRLVEPTEIAAG